MNPVYDTIVLGAGPAGAAAALGLAQLGARVLIIGRPRIDAVEGISARTLARLCAAGLHGTAAQSGTATPRLARWAGEQAARGEEFLIARGRFDSALHRDLLDVRVRVRNLAAKWLSPCAAGWQVHTVSETLKARTVIDARGRRARRADEVGPRLMAWCELYEQPGAIKRGSAVVALQDGWCWLACTGAESARAGRMTAQFIGAPGARFSRSRFLERIHAACAMLPELGFSIDDARLIGKSGGRAAVARFSRPAQATGVLRIGDAAIAMDPLSGHGIYEALGSAQVAVAALNTHLNGGDWTPIARFVDERAGECWRRNLSTAADFYHRQAAHAGSAFWQSTAAAYAGLAAAAGPRDSGPGRFEWRPVLKGQRIEMRPVWVSSEWPRGIWHVNGREVAPAAPSTTVHEVLR